MGFIQIKYPDGTSSTEVKLRGRVSDGMLRGEYADKFETGQFIFRLSRAN